MKRVLLSMIFCLCAWPASAQVPVTLAPVIRQQFFSSVGVPLAGGRLFSYAAGTNTLQNTYRDSTGTGTNTNPIVLDSTGSANIWLAGLSYKFVMQDAIGNQLWSADNVSDLAYINGLNAMLLTGNQTAAGNKTFTGNTTIANLTLGTFDGFVYVDGVTFPTIQSAINSLPPGGGTVYIPCGTYTLSSTLQLASALILQGCGMGSGTAGGTRLVAGSGTLTPMIQAQGVSAANRITDIFIRDMTIQGVYTVTQQCVTMDHATYVVFDHVQFSGCGQAEWINDVYRTTHDNVSYFNSGSGGTNVTAIVRVENTSNPGVQAEQAFWDTSVWQGGANEGMAVYFGPAENTSHIVNSKIDYTGFSPNFCLIQFFQGSDLSLINNNITSPTSVAPANGLVCADGTAPTPAFNLTMVNNPVVVYGTTVPAVYLNFASYHEINNNQFFGGGAGNPAIVTTANTSVGTIMHNRINTFPDTVLNDVSGIQVACNMSSGANRMSCTTPINTDHPITSTSTISTTLGLTDTSTATKVKRPYYNQGTALTNGDGVLSGGWGTSPSIVVSGYDPAFSVIATSGTGSPTPNPSVTVTFKDGAWTTANPICQASRGDIGAPTTGWWSISSTTTQVILTFVGTPITSAAYPVNVTCGGRQ